MSAYRAGGSESEIPHYYGDVVRVIFVVVAAACIVILPFQGNSLSMALPFELAFVIGFLVLAGITNPHGKTILVLDAIASGIGIVFFEAIAVELYKNGSFGAFLIPEAMAIMLMAAFYFSIKTIRAMLMHRIGHEIEVGEFDDEDDLDD